MQSRLIHSFSKLILNRSDEEGAQLAFIAKTHLTLSWMNVDVHSRGFHPEEKKNGRVTTFGNIGMISFHHSIGKGFAVNWPLVDHKDHFLPS